MTAVSCGQMAACGPSPAAHSSGERRVDLDMCQDVVVFVIAFKYYAPLTFDAHSWTGDKRSIAADKSSAESRDGSIGVHMVR
jgi:hypothetical protein